MILLMLALLATFLGQWLMVSMLGPLRAIGDESSYLSGSSSADPHQPEYFLRVPLFVEMFVWSRKLTGKAESITWLIMVAGLMTMFATIVATYAAGLNALWVAIAFLLAPELLVFNRRYWPDPLLAMVGTFVTILLWQFSDVHGLVFGLAILMAVMIRIEQLILIPAIALAWFLIGTGKGFLDYLGLILPSLLVLGIWTLVCWRRYRIPWPDTTWKFNLAIAHHESRQPMFTPVIIPQLVKAQIKQRQANNTGANQSVKHWNPGFARIPLRWLAMLGRETFISDRLLPPNGLGFPSALCGRVGCLWLRYGFTLVCGLTICLSVLNGRLEPHLVPTIVLFFTVSSLHARTRYRVILLPGLAIMFATEMSAHNFSQSWMIMLFAVILSLGLGSINFRTEKP